MALQQAARLHRQGDLAGARRAAEAALKAAPNDPAIHQFLGVVCCQAGDPEKGVTHLKKSLQAAPAVAMTRLNLAKALAALGRLDEAESVCAQGAGQPEIWRMLGDIRKVRGRLSEAIDAYRRAVALKPDFMEAWNNLANSLRAAGDTEAALQAFDRAVALGPNHAAVHLNRGRALAEAGRIGEAIAAYEAALRLSPSDADVQMELGAALQCLGRHAEGLALLERARAAKPAHAPLLAAIGLAFAALNREAEAGAAYRDALTAQPDYFLANLNLGLLLEQSGRLDELEAALRSAEAAGVPAAALGVLHASLAKRRGDDAEALRLAEAALGDSKTALLRAQLMGELNDRLGRPAAAFAAYREMNRRAAEEPAARQCNPHRYRAEIERLINLTTPEWVAGWTTAEVSGARPAPAFLLGFPRSGTTLLDTMLFGHPDIRVLEEAPLVWRMNEAAGDAAALGRLDAERLGQLRRNYLADLDALVADAATACVVDKLPLHIVRTALIHRVFPDAKLIFALRHPCDAVLSSFMQNFQINDAMANFFDIRDAAILYDRVMTYWTRCTDLLPLNVHTLRYEALIADPEAELRALVSFLGLAWNDAVLEHQRSAAARGRIFTPSYAQVSQKLYARAAGRWERYRTELAEVIPMLAPWAERFGYGAL